MTSWLQAHKHDVNLWGQVRVKRYKVAHGAIAITVRMARGNFQTPAEALLQMPILARLPGQLLMFLSQHFSLCITCCDME